MKHDLIDLAGTFVGSLAGALFIWYFVNLPAAFAYEIGVIAGFVAGRWPFAWLPSNS